MEIVAKQRVFEGELVRIEHASKTNNCNMTASVFLPPLAVSHVSSHPVPVLYWLSGLTCNDQNFAQKAGAFRAAADLNVAIVMPDTSPRGYGVADDPDGSYDFGLGAGFYVNATSPTYALNYQMYDYVVSELPALIESNFPVNQRRAICGHSMGGHGALVIGLRNQEKYCSISAFSPICNPTECSWGQKAFTGYLGNNQQAWLEYDATALLKRGGSTLPIRIDQGSEDEFLSNQLHPEAFLKVAQDKDVKIDYGLHTGYDHSYYFISTFIDKHLAFHAEHLFNC
ncbi:S-formylglutathione hydrolase [Alteromonas sp. ASW11-36]|uniref:S-formylglutathione hydrolase n=1 Tax=Alteromonas arenosi TaxID=3055817 RepID=A0ABT7SZ37_9ALTE|nr:S-formylglutathione hydrolase [Alteromonas sp. ASW11-36]MDM7861440.1 S-formylglutathione hydrolase [Alteromonas sp. ASW11-36]